MLQVGYFLSERFAKRGGSVEVDLSFVLQRLSSIEAGRRSFDGTVVGLGNTCFDFMNRVIGGLGGFSKYAAVLGKFSNLMRLGLS